MVNYNIAKIYKIVDNTNDNIYIGSTCEPTLAKRLAKHVSNYKDYTKGGKSGYMTSYEIIKNTVYEILLVEDYPCENKDQLHSRERYWTNKIKCVNKNKNQGIISELGHDQYRKEYKKKYSEDNKDKILEKAKIYYLENKQVIQEKQKEYNKIKKTELKLYRKLYNEINKEKLNEKCDCPCGGNYTIRKGKARHLLTAKHKLWIEENN